MDASNAFLEEYNNDIQDHSESVNRSWQDVHLSQGMNAVTLMTNSSEKLQSSHPYQNANYPIDLPGIGYYSRGCPDFRLSLGMSAVTLVTNILICIVLLQKHMRNATNTLLVAMAVADLLTSVLPAPLRIYFEVLGNKDEWVPYNWCHYNEYFTTHFFHGLAVPMIFHNTSIWITVLLAAQRCINLYSPLLAKRICTVKAALLSVTVIVPLVLASYWGEFLLCSELSPVTIKSLRYVNQTVVGCKYGRSEYSHSVLGSMKNIDLLVIALFNYLIPCVSLVVLNSVLVATLWKAYLRRRQILNQTQRAAQIQTTLTTTMLIILVAISLISELPIAFMHFVYYCWLYSYTYNESICHSLYPKTGFLLKVSPCILHVTFPINFVLYCAMSRDFRNTALGMFKKVLCRQVPRQGMVQGTRLSRTNQS